MTAEKKRKRAPKKRGQAHPGVVLVAPGLRTKRWQGRYVDPDKGKTRWESVPATATTAEAREEWAKAKSRELLKRKAELAGGATRATGKALPEIIKRYYAAHPHLRAKTLEGYQGATKKLEEWAAAHLDSADELTRARMMEFRESLIRQPKRLTVKGGKRGQRADSAKPRSPERVNSEMRKVQTVLGYLVDAQLFPRLTRDDLRVSMKRIPVTSERIQHLRPSELAALLKAAAKHDAETYVETRAEHAGEGRARIGTTPRYQPTAQFIAFVLLTGCRLGEGLGLEWSAVDLDALDHDGRKVGEVHLTGAETKTRRARTIGLEVSPALYGMLKSMREQAGGDDAAGSVFALSRGEAEAAVRRLLADYDAPKRFTWQMLRRTCGTFLTNAPGIFGAASAYRSAKQLGHSVQVAEKHYVGLVRGIPPSAKTLDAAMQLEAVLASVLERVPASSDGKVLALVRRR